MSSNVVGRVSAMKSRLRFSSCGPETIAISTDPSETSCIVGRSCGAGGILLDVDDERYLPALDLMVKVTMSTIWGSSSTTRIRLTAADLVVVVDAGHVV